MIVDESHRLRRRRALFNYGSYDKANEALELDKEATDWTGYWKKVGISYSFMIPDNR